MLKHLPKDSFKKIQNTLLYDNTAVYYNKTTIDRRTYNSNTVIDITDLNINERLQKLKNQLKNEYVYRIPLRFYLGKINFPLKIDFRIKCHFKPDMKKLFESKKQVTTVAASNVQIIFTKVPFIKYEQFLLDKNFRQYLEIIMVYKKT